MKGGEMRKLTFFIGGIIQGSIGEKKIHSQDYRERIKEIILKEYENAKVICPFSQHPDSINYNYKKGKKTFFNLVEIASQSDVLIAYLPEASMGTGIEMWEAKKKGRLIISISPLEINWCVKYLSDVICRDIEEFEKFILDGNLKHIEHQVFPE